MKKGIFYGIGGVLLAAAVFFGVRAAMSANPPEATKTEAFAPTSTPTATPTPTARPTATPTAEPTPEPTPTPEPYVSPIDFEGLQALNPDIYAWLEIPGTDISYPLLQSQTDDTYYLDHNSDKVYSANGSIYSESAYNGLDFTDPVTLLYGHHMRSGAMFGNLQQLFSDFDFFEETPTFTIYTPEAELTFGVFAATPYSGAHILYYNDFEDEQVFTDFFDEVMNGRSLGSLFREDYAPVPGDSVVILSTCLIGNNTNRFLVMGTLLP